LLGDFEAAGLADSPDSYSIHRTLLQACRASGTGAQVDCVEKAMRRRGLSVEAAVQTPEAAQIPVQSPPPEAVQTPEAAQLATRLAVQLDAQLDVQLAELREARTCAPPPEAVQTPEAAQIPVQSPPPEAVQTPPPEAVQTPEAAQIPLQSPPLEAVETPEAAQIPVQSPPPEAVETPGDSPAMVSESSTLAELRAHVKELGLDIKTSGPGRNKKAILSDILASTL